jgi:hypothetical protein
MRRIGNDAVGELHAPIAVSRTDLLTGRKISNVDGKLCVVDGNGAVETAPATFATPSGLSVQILDGVVRIISTSIEVKTTDFKTMSSIRKQIGENFPKALTEDELSSPKEIANIGVSSLVAMDASMLAIPEASELGIANLVAANVRPKGEVIELSMPGGYLNLREVETFHDAASADIYDITAAARSIAINEAQEELLFVDSEGNILRHEVTVVEPQSEHGNNLIFNSAKSLAQLPVRLQAGDCETNLPGFLFFEPKSGSVNLTVLTVIDGIPQNTSAIWTAEQRLNTETGQLETFALPEIAWLAVNAEGEIITDPSGKPLTYIFTGGNWHTDDRNFSLSWKWTTPSLVLGDNKKRHAEF